MISYSSAARKQHASAPVLMTYDDYEYIRRSISAERNGRRARERERRMKYYRRQKLFGAVIMAVGAFFLGVGCGINENIVQYFGAGIGAVGLYTIITRRMILVDKYYLEYHDRINEY